MQAKQVKRKKKYISILIKLHFLPTILFGSILLKTHVLLFFVFSFNLSIITFSLLKNISSSPLSTARYTSFNPFFSAIIRTAKRVAVGDEKVRNGRRKIKGACTGCPEKELCTRPFQWTLTLTRWKKYAGAVKVQRYAKAPENCYVLFLFFHFFFFLETP